MVDGRSLREANNAKRRIVDADDLPSTTYQTIGPVPWIGRGLIAVALVALTAYCGLLVIMGLKSAPRLKLRKRALSRKKTVRSAASSALALQQLVTRNVPQD